MFVSCSLWRLGSCTQVCTNLLNNLHATGLSHTLHLDQIAAGLTLGQIDPVLRGCCLLLKDTTVAKSRRIDRQNMQTYPQSATIEVQRMSIPSSCFLRN